MVTEYTVEGMTCGHCAAAVTRELTALTGVSSVDVDVASGRVSVTREAALPVEDVRAAIDEAGYSLVGA